MQLKALKIIFMLLVFVSAVPTFAKEPDNNKISKCLESSVFTSEKFENTSEYFEIREAIYINKSNKIAVHWTLLGPTYWKDNLSLLIDNGDTYEKLDSITIKGIGESLKVENNIIRLEYKAYRKSDPRCCPSLKRINDYEVLNGKIRLKEK